MVYQDSGSLAPSVPKGSSIFEMLLVKVFSLKQKRSQTLPNTIEKINFFLFKKTASCFSMFQLHKWEC